jgi:hypothetical protein
MKIQHIRKNGRFIGTIVAVKDEQQHEVKVGFSVVMKCDQLTQNFSKKRGVEIAANRALKQTHNKVPKKIEPEFREFVAHCANVKAFTGFKVPSPDDFVYTLDPIHQHNKKDDVFAKFFQ